MKRFVFACIMLLLVAQRIAAQQQFTGAVTFLTSTSVYVNLGTHQGFDVGDTIRVVKNGKEIALLQVSTIASKSLSATYLSRTGDVREGDAVIGFTLRSPKKQESIMKIDSTIEAQSPPSTPITTHPPTTEIPSQGNIMHGRIGVQYYALKTGSSTTLDFNQPASVLNLSVDKIFHAPLSFSMYLNSRYDARNNSLRQGITDARLSNRIYEMSLRWGEDISPYSILMGRFVAPLIGGIGTFDGLMASMHAGDVRLGIVGGSQPGWKNSDVQFSSPKFAAFASMQSGSYSSTYYQGSVAYAQQYYEHHLDRGFMYVQNNLSLPNSLSFYQNANFDLHDVVDGERQTSFHLTDFYISGSYRPLNWLATNASWSIRRNIFYLESFKFLPDSLFEKSTQQNAQVSVGIRLPMTLYLTTTGSIRTKEGDSRNATSVMLNLAWADMFNTQIGMYISGAIADNVYSKTTNYGIDLHADISQTLYLSLKARNYLYTFTSSNRSIQRTTLGLDCLYRISQMFSTTLSYERYLESNVNSDRLYVEASVRF